MHLVFKLYHMVFSQALSTRTSECLMSEPPLPPPPQILQKIKGDQHPLANFSVFQQITVLRL